MPENIKSWPKPTYFKWSTWVKKLKPHFRDLWIFLKIDAFQELAMVDIPFCPGVLHGASCFWSTKMNIFIFPQGSMFVTLRDVMAFTGLPIGGEDVINDMKEP